MSHSSEAAARMSRGGLERERERVARLSLSLSLSWHPPGTMACSLVHVQVGVGVGGQRLSTSTIVSGPVPRVGTRGYTWVHRCSTHGTMPQELSAVITGTDMTARYHHLGPWTLDHGWFLVITYNTLALHQGFGRLMRRRERGRSRVKRRS